MKSLLRNLLICYLVLLLLVWAVVRFDTGSSWWVSLFLFSPRWVLGLPWLVLFPLTLLIRFRLAGLYLVHLAILLFLLLDFRAPIFNNWNSDATGPSLRVITCNLGEGPIRIEQLVELIQRHRTEVLIVQECTPSMGQNLFQQLGWDYQQRAGLAVGSSLPQGPIQIVSQQMVNGYPAIVAVAADVDLQPRRAAIGSDQAAATSAPQWGRIVAIHFPTFRPAFEKAQRFDYSGTEQFARSAESYRDYAAQTRSEVEATELHATELPTILAGDFNVPVDSVFYRDYWSSFQNALSLRGWGFSYTKYTRFHGVRIDHVLADAQWEIRSAQVGPNLGGDHRPVIVELQLRPNGLTADRRSR